MDQRGGGLLVPSISAIDHYLKQSPPPAINCSQKGLAVSEYFIKVRMLGLAWELLDISVIGNHSAYFVDYLFGAKSSHPRLN